MTFVSPTGTTITTPSVTTYHLPATTRVHKTTDTAEESHMGWIIFLSLAWVATLLVCYFVHRPKPCVCRDVVVQQATPTHVTHHVPFQGTYHIPVVQSPGLDADIVAITDFLRRKGTNVHGQAFNSDIFKTLTMPWVWEWNTGVSPPVATFNGSGIVPGTYYITYDTAANQWTVTSTSPFS